MLLEKLTLTPSLVAGPPSTTSCVPNRTVIKPSINPVPIMVEVDPGFTVETELRVGTICRPMEAPPFKREMGPVRASGGTTNVRVVPSLVMETGSAVVM